MKIDLEYRNAQYANAEKTMIDVEINHPVFGWIPFTATPDDIQEYGRNLFQFLKKGRHAAPYKGASE